MNARKWSAAILAAVFVVVAICGCGGDGAHRHTSTNSDGNGGGPRPTAVSPADAAPADTVTYLQLNGARRAQVTRVVSTLGKLASTYVGPQLIRSCASALRWDGGAEAFYRRMRPWLSSPQVGIAILSPGVAPLSGGSHEDAVMIFTARNPAAAAQQAAALILKQPPELRGSAATAGKYVLVGGKQAVSAAAAAQRSGSTLAAVASYRRVEPDLNHAAIVSAYVPLARLADHNSTLSSYWGSLPGTPTTTATAAIGVELEHAAIRFDVSLHGVRVPEGGSAPASVSSLPAGASVSIASAGRSSGADAARMQEQAFLRDISQFALVAGRVAGYSSGQLPSPLLKLIAEELTPGLGGFTTSLAGTTRTGLQSGFMLTPVSSSTRSALLSNLYRLARGGFGSAVSGGPGGFRIAFGYGGTAHVVSVGGHVVATDGYADPQQYLNPSATLAQDPTFRSARAQLGAGFTRVPLFLNTQTLARLAALNPARTGTMINVLQTMRYVITGVAGDRERIVIGLR